MTDDGSDDLGGFEPFDYEPPTGGRFGGNAISVRRNGDIGLGKQFMKQYGLKGFCYARLHYDRNSDQIALRFLSDYELGAAPVRNSQNGWSIPAKQFVESYEIAPGRFDTELDDETELFICERGGCQ